MKIKKLFFVLMLSLCMNFVFVNDANADNYQYVMTSDGIVHALPADFSEEMVLWFIDTYETMLQMKQEIDRYNGKVPVQV